MLKCWFITVLLLFNFAIIIGQTEIRVPEFNDDYSKTVQMLENGKTDNEKHFEFNFSSILL